MNYLKIQFKNGTTKEYKTSFSNPNNDTLKELNNGLFIDYSNLDKKIKDCTNLELFYTKLNNEKTFIFLGAKVLDFRKIDGRIKQAKALKYYSHRFLFENYK